MKKIVYLCHIAGDILCGWVAGCEDQVWINNTPVVCALSYWYCLFLAFAGLSDCCPNSSLMGTLMFLTSILELTHLLNLCITINYQGKVKTNLWSVVNKCCLSGIDYYPPKCLHGQMGAEHSFPQRKCVDSPIALENGEWGCRATKNRLRPPNFWHNGANFWHRSAAISNTKKLIQEGGATWSPAIDIKVLPDRK
jgi:hypothetical protein